MKHLAARLLTMLFTVALGCALCLVLYYMDKSIPRRGLRALTGFWYSARPISPKTRFTTSSTAGHFIPTCSLPPPSSRRRATTGT